MTPRREMVLALGLVLAGAAAASNALAVVVLAGAGASLLVGTRARQLLGAVQVVVGGVLVLTGLTPTRVASLVGGSLVVLGATVQVLRSGRWPRPTGYATTTKTDDVPGRGDGSPREAWDALDRGEDPTA